MQKNRGKEIKLDINSNYKISFGSVDSKNPKAIYLKISGWGLPTNDDIEVDYNNVIKKLNKKIRLFVYNNLDRTLFESDRSIIDLDMRESGIVYSKKSFMSCEITLFQLNNYELNQPIVVNHLECLLRNLIEDVFEDDEYFKFYKDKK